MTQPTSKDTREQLEQAIGHFLISGDRKKLARAFDQHMRQLINDYHRNNSVLTKARAE